MNEGDPGSRAGVRHSPSTDRPDRHPIDALLRARWTRRVILLLVLVLAAYALWRQWTSLNAEAPNIRLSPVPLAVASALVLAAYAVLVESWRRVLQTWGGALSFWRAAGIWTISNLGKYVPGKVWQITAMTVMLQREGIQLNVSGAAAIAVTIANVASGLILTLLFGAPLLALGGVPRSYGVLLLVFLLLMLLALPRAVSAAVHWYERRRGRETERLSGSGVGVSFAVLGCAAAWLLYGLAFRELSRGVIGHAEGSILGWTAVYAGSYLAGYLAFFAPGGIGVREMALAASLPAAGLTTPGEAVVLTLASRLWLTLIEVVPGALVLAHRRK